MIASARVDVCAGGHSLIVMKKASHQFAAGSFAGPSLEKRETWGAPGIYGAGEVGYPPMVCHRGRGHPPSVGVGKI